MTKFILALQFLTRIQLKPDLVVDDRNFGKSMIYFPLVGLVVGLILAAASHIFSLVFTPLVVGALLIWLEVTLSGGLHLDGFMDTMDGIYSGRSRERILEIMRDSRVGAHSAIALVCLFLLKLTILVDYPKSFLVPTLILVPSLSRLTQVVGVVCFPYAREEGLAKSFNTHVGGKELFLACFISLIICLLVMQWLGMVFFLITIGTALGLGYYVKSKIGGLTGDVYGAITEIAELILLYTGYLIFH